MLSSRTLSSSGSVRRYYDPGAGQFISVDPLVDQTGSPYGYAAGDPVNNYDLAGTTYEEGGVGEGGTAGSSGVDETAGARDPVLPESAKDVLKDLEDHSIERRDNRRARTGGRAQMLRDLRRFLKSGTGGYARQRPEMTKYGPATIYTLSDGTRVTSKLNTRTGTPGLDVNPGAGPTIRFHYP